MDSQKMSLETKLIHAGEPGQRFAGAVNVPIFQSSTYEYRGQSSYHDITYIRLNNTPNHEVLHKKLAALENAEAAVVTASGMAAITTAILALLSTGDHLLAQNCLYGGTHQFLTRDLNGFGIAYDFIDGDDPDDWTAKLRPNTKAILVETMTNPLLEIADLVGIVEFARRHGLVTIVDNTFASPVNFRPAEWGLDLSIHSGTKYLNGHSDIVAGAVIGKRRLVKQITRKLNHLGGTLDPHACFLLHRGLKTLALRMHYQNASALKIATFLRDHPIVERVFYPGLETHPQHARAQEWFDGFGGMLSFELKGAVEQAEQLMARLKLPLSAPSLGGVETLITRPATTSHSGMSAEERAALGITDGLLRLSVGIEATDDLIADLQQALDAIA